MCRWILSYCTTNTKLDFESPKNLKKGILKKKKFEIKICVSNNVVTPW